MDIFTALADPTRRHIIEILANKGRLTASDISDKFHVSPPAISQHLKVLKETKLVDMEKHAQQRIYTLNPNGISELEEWTRKMKKNWDERFQKLDTLLEKEMRKST